MLKFTLDEKDSPKIIKTILNGFKQLYNTSTSIQNFINDVYQQINSYMQIYTNGQMPELTTIIKILVKLYYITIVQF